MGLEVFPPDGSPVAAIMQAMLRTTSPPLDLSIVRQLKRDCSRVWRRAARFLGHKDEKTSSVMPYELWKACEHGNMGSVRKQLKSLVARLSSLTPSDEMPDAAQEKHSKVLKQIAGLIEETEKLERSYAPNGHWPDNTIVAVAATEPL